MADPQEVQAFLRAAALMGNIVSGETRKVGGILGLGGKQVLGENQYRQQLEQMMDAAQAGDSTAVQWLSEEFALYSGAGLVDIDYRGKIVGVGQPYLQSIGDGTVVPTTINIDPKMVKNGVISSPDAAYTTTGTPRNLPKPAVGEKATGNTIPVVTPGGVVLGHQQIDESGNPVGTMIKLGGEGDGLPLGALIQQQTAREQLAESRRQFDITQQVKERQSTLDERNRRATAIQNAINALSELSKLGISPGRQFYPGQEPGGLVESMLGATGRVPVQHVPVDPWAAVQEQMREV